MAGNLTAMIAAAFSGSAAPPVTSDPYFDYTTLLLPGNGTNGAQNNTFLDSSTNNFTITRNGNTTQGTFSPFSQTGWGNYFNGSASLFTTSSPSSAANFTMEAWVYRTAATLGVVIGYGSETTGRVFMYLTSGGGLTVSIYGVGDTTFGGSIPLNQWTHVAIVRASNIITGYIDGTAQATTTTNSSTFGNTGGFGIGAGQNASNKFTGYISNARVVDGVAVYTGNFTVPTSALTATQSAGTNISAITTGQTKLLTCQSNRFVDNGQGNTGNTGYPISTVGSPSVQAFSPFNPSASWSAATYGGSGYFDGSGDYLTATTSSLNTTTFTLEFWGYFTVLNSGSPYYVFNLSGGGSGQLLIGKNDPGFPGRCLFVDNSGSTVFNLQGGTINANEWTHFACVKDGANASLWINGTRVATTSSAATSPTFSGTSAFWGGLNSSVAVITGYLSSFRLVSGSAVYSTSSTSITVPTAPLTAITNTSLLLNYTNAGIYDATSKNDLETVGNAQISTTQSKWGGSSMYFDGSGDYLTQPSTAPSSELFRFGTGDFTFEAWVRFASVGNTTLVTMNTTSGFYWQYVSSNLAFGRAGGGTNVNGSWSPSANTWYHVATVRSGNTVTHYIDGTSIGSGSFTDNISAITTLQIASGVTGSLNGYMQDLRITKYARYTSNFTPPTAAFPTQ